MKGLSIALRILAIIGAAAAAYGWYATKGKVQEAEQKTDAVRAQVSEVESQLGDKDNEITGLRGNVRELENQLADEKNRSTNFRTQYSQAQREISNMREDTDEVKKEYSDLERRHDQLKRELIELNTSRPTTATVDTAQLTEYEDRIAGLQSELRDTKDKLTALQLRAGANATADTNEDGTPAMAQVDEQKASILRSDPGKGIIVISRGQVDGLQRQMEFNIAKGLSRPVRVKVGTVAPTYSVAYIMPGQDPSHLQAGDEVSLSQ